SRLPRHVLHLLTGLDDHQLGARMVCGIGAHRGGGNRHHRHQCHSQGFHPQHQLSTSFQVHRGLVGGSRAHRVTALHSEASVRCHVSVSFVKTFAGNLSYPPPPTAAVGEVIWHHTRYCHHTPYCHHKPSLRAASRTCIRSNACTKVARRTDIANRKVATRTDRTSV